ncbi:hypothetical protein ACQKL5_13730 [Peribacillus sp. NPDC097675]|uniref:hypothetical protein n=1 Tax=Peribacillus sp. NPDC097675 TaxID=3390618 RepID=UPI003D0226A8
MSDLKAETTKILELEKLNIVDENGTIRMSLFNNENIPPAFMDGIDILPGHRQNDPIAGLMFYNKEGDECGGLIYGNDIDENGKVTAGASLTFDQYKQDQVVQMKYSEDEYGFYLFDRPNTPLSQVLKKEQEIKNSKLDPNVEENELNELWKGNVQRGYMGKSPNGEVAVKLMDSKGNDRIRMVVDSFDIPRMEFLDGEGNVIYKLPPE